MGKEYNFFLLESMEKWRKQIHLPGEALSRQNVRSHMSLQKVWNLGVCVCLFQCRDLLGASNSCINSIKSWAASRPGWGSL